MKFMLCNVGDLRKIYFSISFRFAKPSCCVLAWCLYKFIVLKFEILKLNFNVLLVFKIYFKIFFFWKFFISNFLKIDKNLTSLKYSNKFYEKFRKISKTIKIFFTPQIFQACRIIKNISHPKKNFMLFIKQQSKSFYGITSSLVRRRIKWEKLSAVTYTFNLLDLNFIFVSHTCFIKPIFLIHY